ncbi:unnamed protein product [Musa banksii]
MAINVWKDNLVEQVDVILRLRGSFPYVAIDTEFPGFIRSTPRHASEEERYDDMKYNVDHMRLIQLGLTLFDKDGNTPWPGCCWQFNFSDFDPDTDACSEDSIELLLHSGHNLQKNQRDGVDAYRCSYLLCVKLFRHPHKSKYITFHGLYDVAFLIQMITRAPLPNTLNEFLVLTRSVFGDDLYDIKYISRFCEGLHEGKAGLLTLSKLLELEPVGIRHQAAYDSLLIRAIFNKMKQLWFDIEDERFVSVLYGLENNCMKSKKRKSSTVAVAASSPPQVQPFQHYRGLLASPFQAH